MGGASFRFLVLLGVALVVVAWPAVGRAATPFVNVTVFARTGHDMDSMVWTGREFLYVVNTQNDVFAASRLAN